MRTIFVFLFFFFYFIDLTAQNDSLIIKGSFKKLLKQGWALHDSADYEAALPYALKAKEKAIRIYGKNHKKYGDALLLLGGIYTDMRKFDSITEAIYIECKSVYAKTIGKNCIDYVATLNNLGLYYFYTGKYNQVEPLLIEVLTISKKTLGENHPDYATYLHNLAMLYNNMSDYLKAESLYIEALRIDKNTIGENHPQYAVHLNSLAVLYWSIGDYLKVEPLYVEALKIDKKTLGENHPQYGIHLGNLAELYSAMGDYLKAEPLYIEALKIDKKTLGEKHSEYVARLNGLAELYRQVGNYPKAEPLYIEALKIDKNTIGENHPDYAIHLNNLALLHNIKEDYEKAESLLLEVLNIDKKSLGENHPQYARHLHNLAGIYKSMGKYTKAESLLIEALKIDKNTLGGNHLQYGMHLITLAGLYNTMGDYPNAERLYLEGLEIDKNTIGENHPYYASHLRYLGDLYYNMGAYPKAEPFFIEGTKIYLNSYENNNIRLSEKEREKYWGTIKGNFEKFQNFTKRRYPSYPQITQTTYENTLKTKGILLQGTQVMLKAIENNGDSALIVLFSQWKAQKAALAKWYEMSPKKREKLGVNLQIEEEEANQVEKELSLRSQAFKEAMDTTTIQWSEVKGKLKEGEAAMEIVRFRLPDKNKKFTDTVYYAAMIITPQSDYPAWVLLTEGNKMESVGYKNYLQNIAKRDDNSWELYWAKIDSALGNAYTVYLSTDGIYNQINLAALQSPNKKRVMDTRNIHLLYSTADLVKPAKPLPSTSPTAALYGRPKYDMSPQAWTQKVVELVADNQLPKDYFSRSMDSLDRGNIKDLPGTEKEVYILDSLLRKSYLVKTYIKDEAIEERIKASHSPTILHIATHGFYLPAKEVGTNRDEMFMGTSATAATENPLLRSGLLFTGAKYTLDNKDSMRIADTPDRENGILTAYEASLLDLSGTDLVVLSACQTGLGQVSNGEGVYGLQRAFRMAGARTMLISLWKVPDVATQELMVGFYTRYLSGQRKYDALRETQMEMAKKYLPLYWAGFVLVGE